MLRFGKKNSFCFDLESPVSMSGFQNGQDVGSSQSSSGDMWGNGPGETFSHRNQSTFQSVFSVVGSQIWSKSQRSSWNRTVKKDLHSSILSTSTAGSIEVSQACKGCQLQFVSAGKLPPVAVCMCLVSRNPNFLQFAHDVSMAYQITGLWSSKCWERVGFQVACSLQNFQSVFLCQERMHAATLSNYCCDSDMWFFMYSDIKNGWHTIDWQEVRTISRCENGCTHVRPYEGPPLSRAFFCPKSCMVFANKSQFLRLLNLSHS